MSRKLFCEISPLTYAVSVWKEKCRRYILWLFSRRRYAKTFGGPLPVVVCDHASLIRRTLGHVDMVLQENKAVNLKLSAPKVNGVLIGPGETFSFWKLVGRTSRAKGYRTGLTIERGKPSQDIGGGLCQFTNLLHWLALHSPLEITEHHHHDRFDLFPDCDRKIPFGTGTSIMYNYLDYQLHNPTDRTFQFMVRADDTHLRGELRADRPLDEMYSIREEDMHFVRMDDGYYRNNTVYQDTRDALSGQVVGSRLIKTNHAKVMYDESLIDKALIRT